MPDPNPEPFDPFAPDAPILHLLSQRDNPLLATATEEQLIALITRFRQTAQQPQVMKAELSKRPTMSAKKKELWDSI